MIKEDILYASSNIPADFRAYFEQLPKDERFFSIICITIANNARLAAGLNRFDNQELKCVIQAIENNIPVLCAPDTKPTNNISKLHTPIALLSGDDLQKQVKFSMSTAASNPKVKQYYKENIDFFDKRLVSLADDETFGLKDGKYYTKACHPMNYFVKRIKADVNQARYFDERSIAFLHKAGEIEEDNDSSDE